MIVRLLRAESCMKEKEGITGGNAAAFVANTCATSAGVSRTKNERDARKKEITDKKVTECWKCGEKGHWSWECSTDKKNKKTEASTTNSGAQKAYHAYMTTLTPLLKDAWFADSGCSEHMTESRDVFNTYCDISSQHRPVEGIGGTIIYVQGIGDIIIKVIVDNCDEISILKDVLHVPNLGKNLFSISRVAMRNIETIHLRQGVCLEHEGRIIMQGVQE